MTDDVRPIRPDVEDRLRDLVAGSSPGPRSIRVEIGSSVRRLDIVRAGSLWSLVEFRSDRSPVEVSNAPTFSVALREAKHWVADLIDDLAGGGPR